MRPASAALVTTVVLLASLAACAREGPPPSTLDDGGASRRPRSEATAKPQVLRVETYRKGLSFPVDMAWVEGTRRFFFTEKDTGRVRVMVGRRLIDRPCADLDVAAEGERGALGIVLHPDFSTNAKLYVYYTNRSPLENRVSQFTVEENRCVDERAIVTGISASSSGYHNGGQLEFVGNKLFVATGEAHLPATAQATDNLLGKILRFNADGTIPASNPFNEAGERNPVWSYGHRNPFGLAVRAGTSQLFESENGPGCDDELNRILPGRNYGWGDLYECGTPGVGPNPEPPLARWGTVIVPTDLFWYVGRISSLSDDLYMGDFAQGRLHRFHLNDEGTRILDRAVVHDAPEGIVDVTNGPGGWLYFMTPSAIYRIVAR